MEKEKFTEKEYYRQKIIGMVEKIESLWILEQILRCIINITKGES